VLTRRLRLGVGWLVPLGICLGLSPLARGDQFDTLRTYWQNYLIASGGNPANLANRAGRSWESMNTNTPLTSLWNNGSFGLNSSGSTVTRAFSQLETMALAWATPGCPLHGNTNLAAAIDSGLDWMVANVYTPTGYEYDNWWDWEIGGAQNFNNAFALMYPTLTGAEITNYCAAIDGHSPGGPANTYGWQRSANTADMALVMFIRGILGKDKERMTQAKMNLSTVFAYVTTGDGFYTDGSFVFHTDKAYTGGYGVALLNATSDLINLLEGSQWQFTDSNKTSVINWVSNSFEPVIYNGALMDMVRGRNISRGGGGNETENTNRNRALFAIRQVARFAPPATAAAFSNFADAPLLPPGQFQFAGMDRVVALRNGFGVGVSMSSSRIAIYESIHRENLHGWFTGDGMTYLYVGPVETQFAGDFWPTVDAYHLPGTTVEITPRTAAQGANKRPTQHWVGGAQVSGSYGTAGMSLANPLSPSLTAKKSWFMFDSEVVCLGAGVTCGDPAEIDTTVEDRRLGTDPTNHFTVNGTVITPVMGWSNNLSNVSWCALDGVGGYYFPGGAASLQAAFVSNSGSWSDIGGRRRGRPNTDDYLKLWYNHGVNPTNATYAYVLLPNMTASSVAAYAADPDIVVLANTPEVQAAKKPSLGVVAANFWTGGTHSIDLITANAPSSIITSQKSSGFAVGISDPTQTNRGSITVTLNRAASALVSADPSVTVEQLSPKIVLSVNLNRSLGKTFQASFRCYK
jgi:hyaluronate lyase